MKTAFFARASLAALAVGLAMPAAAQDVQDSPEPTTGEVDEMREEAMAGRQVDVITVTAEFREANLQDTPIAITAVNAEMLEARGQTDIQQVASQAPNVTLAPQSQTNGTGLVAFIRGVGQTSFNYALEPGVGIYIDDVYFPTVTGSLLDLTDLERVEILRGPQGTLAGKNSIGGAIKLFSRKPSGSGEGSLEVSYGSFDALDIRGFADFAVTDNLFARIAVTSKNRDGFITRVDYAATHPGSNVPTLNEGNGIELGTLGGVSYAGTRLSLRWVPSNSVELNVSADYTDDNSEAGASILYDIEGGRSETFYGVPFLQGTDGETVTYDCRFIPAGPNSCDTNAQLGDLDPRYVTYATFLDQRDGSVSPQAPFKPYQVRPIRHYDGFGVQSNLQVDLSDSLLVTWISSFRSYNSQWGQDEDGSPVPSQQIFQTLDFEGWSQELRLNGELADGQIDFTVGGFYYESDGTMEARADLNYSSIDFISGPDFTNTVSKAVFLNATIYPTDNWSVTGGIRYSDDKKSFTYNRSNPDGTAPQPCAGFPFGADQPPNCVLAGLGGTNSVFDDDRIDFRIVTDYRFSENFLVYGSIATGYKGGGVNPYPYTLEQVRTFAPETLTTYEVGFKSDLLSRSLRLNGAAFFNKFDDVILTLNECFGSRPCALPANIGKADVKGFELELLAYPVDGLSIDGAVSYIDFEYTEIVLDAGFDTEIGLDNVTPFTPEWTWNLGVQYDVDIAPGTISLRVDGIYQSHIYTEALNDDAFNRIDGRFLANGRVAFTTEDDDWQVALEVRNIFDKYYFLTKFDQSGGSAGQVSAQPGLPRTFAISVKRNF